MSNARCLLSVASAPRLAFGLHLGGFARALHPGMSTIASGPGESPALCFRRRWGCLQGARSNGPPSPPIWRQIESRVCRCARIDCRSPPPPGIVGVRIPPKTWRLFRSCGILFDHPDSWQSLEERPCQGGVFQLEKRTVNGGSWGPSMRSDSWHLIILYHLYYSNSTTSNRSHGFVGSAGSYYDLHFEDRYGRYSSLWLETSRILWMLKPPSHDGSMPSRPASCGRGVLSRLSWGMENIIAYDLLKASWFWSLRSDVQYRRLFHATSKQTSRLWIAEVEYVHLHK